MEHIEQPLIAAPTGLQELYNLYLKQPYVPEYQAENARDLASKLYEGPNLFPARLLNETPGATIVTPTLLPHESLGNTIRTLHLVQRAVEDIAPVEVVVWGNSKLPEIAWPSGRVLTEEEWEVACKNVAVRTEHAYEELTDAITAQRFDHGIMRVRPAFEYNFSGSKMNTVRQHYMDAITYEATERNFPPGHVVIWLDTDGRIIKIGSFDKMVDTLQDPSVLIAKPNLIFTGDHNNQPLSERSLAEKFTAVYAIARRLVERNCDWASYMGYLDEGCLGMRLETWLRMGGLHTEYDQDRINIGESAVLRDNIRSRIRKPYRQEQDCLAPIFTHVPSAVIGTSYRKILDNAEHGTSARTFFSSLSSSSYQPYITERAICGWPPPSHMEYTQEEMWYVIGELFNSYENASPLGGSLEGRSPAFGEPPASLLRSVTPERADAIRKSYSILKKIIDRFELPEGQSDLS